MRFTRALLNFKNAVYAQYGKDAVVKIGVTPELYQRIMEELLEEERRDFSFARDHSFAEAHRPRLCGVELVPIYPRKDEFSCP